MAGKMEISKQNMKDWGGRFHHAYQDGGSNKHNAYQDGGNKQLFSNVVRGQPPPPQPTQPPPPPTGQGRPTLEIDNWDPAMAKTVEQTAPAAAAEGDPSRVKAGDSPSAAAAAPTNKVDKPQREAEPFERQPSSSCSPKEEVPAVAASTAETAVAPNNNGNKAAAAAELSARATPNSAADTKAAPTAKSPGKDAVADELNTSTLVDCFYRVKHPKVSTFERA